MSKSLVLAQRDKFRGRNERVRDSIVVDGLSSWARRGRDIQGEVAQRYRVKITKAAVLSRVSALALGYKAAGSDVRMGAAMVYPGGWWVVVEPFIPSTGWCYCIQRLGARALEISIK